MVLQIAGNVNVQMLAPPPIDKFQIKKVVHPSMHFNMLVWLSR